MDFTHISLWTGLLLGSWKCWSIRLHSTLNIIFFLMEKRNGKQWHNENWEKRGAQSFAIFADFSLVLLCFLSCLYTSCCLHKNSDLFLSQFEHSFSPYNKVTPLGAKMSIQGFSSDWNHYLVYEHSFSWTLMIKYIWQAIPLKYNHFWWGQAEFSVLLSPNSSFFFRHALIVIWCLILQVVHLCSKLIFSILFSIHFQVTDKENLFNNQELHKLMIISSTLLTLKFDSGVIYCKEKLDASLKVYETSSISKALDETTVNLVH